MTAPFIVERTEMKKLTEVSDAALLSEVQRRRAAKRKTFGAGTGRPKVIKICPGCGGSFSGREYRAHKCDKKGETNATV